VDLRDLRVDPARPLAASWEPELLSGVVVLRGEAGLAPMDEAWRDRLYLSVGDAPAPGTPRPVPFVAVPYLAWGNRAPGAMRVWQRRGAL